MVYEDNSLSQNQQTYNNQPGLVGATPPSGAPAPTTATSTGGINQQSPPSQALANQNTSVQQFNNANRQPSSFTNIRSYINANRAAAPQLGQKIQTNVANQAQAVAQGIQQSQQQFQNQAQNVGNQLAQGQNFVNQIQQSPEQITANQNTLNQFRQLQSNTIGAPGMTVTGQETSGIQNQAQQAGSEAGRFQLLQNMFRNPARAYTQGQQSLDQSILQATPGVAQNLQKGLQNTYQGLQSQDVAAQKAQQKAIANLTQQGLQNKQNIAQALGSWGDQGTGALGNIYNQLTTAQKAAQVGEEQQLEQQKAALAAGNYAAPGIAETLGLGTGTRLYGLDLGQFANQLQLANPNVGLADVANKDQASRLAALSQLANQNIDLGPAGGAPGVSFTGKQSIQDLLAQKAKEYQQQIQNASFTNAVGGTGLNNLQAALIMGQHLSGGEALTRAQQINDLGNQFAEASNPNSPSYNPALANQLGQQYYSTLQNIPNNVSLSQQIINPRLSALQNIMSNYGGFGGGTVIGAGDTTMGVT